MLTTNATVRCNWGMNLRRYISELGNDVARADFARRCGTSLGHMRNIGYGYKVCSPLLAVAIERESGGSATRKELRPADWWLLWPELAPHGVAKAA